MPTGSGLGQRKSRADIPLHVVDDTASARNVEALNQRKEQTVKLWRRGWDSNLRRFAGVRARCRNPGETGTTVFMAERVGFELEAFCGRPSPLPKSRRNRDHGIHGGEGGIRTHGTVSRTLAFEASTFNRSVTSPRSVVSFYQRGYRRGYGVLRAELPKFCDAANRIQRRAAKKDCRRELASAERTPGVTST